MSSQDIPPAITAVSIQGFKSFAEEQRIEIRPLTLLSGANSSGKSSTLQPILLLKQTLEATYDPGPLLLDGPNVRFTASEQILTHLLIEEESNEFRVAIEREGGELLVDTFKKEGYGFEIGSTSCRDSEGKLLVLRSDMTKRELTQVAGNLSDDFVLSVFRYRCFLSLQIERQRSLIVTRLSKGRELARLMALSDMQNSFGSLLTAVIHVPGLRGNPERTYRTTAVGEHFPGRFDDYVAGVISSWQQQDEKRLGDLNASLETLGLTWTVRAKLVNAAQVELLIGRLATRGRNAEDMVNIADVGFGVSQVLPVIVALLTAKPGQLVYLEQPELHLHPRAQQAMASILADAARRGVRVVAETHSSILLLAVQSLIAEGQLDPGLVKLHWFRRDDRGATQVHSTDLDDNGAYGDWPEDFGDVRAEVENRYLNAVEARAFSRPAAKRARTKKK